MSQINKIQVYKINKKYVAYSIIKNKKIFIPSQKIPRSFVRILMKNKYAQSKEIQKWLTYHYI